MINAVRNVILEPMLALYPPPSHLRHDEQAQQRALAAYEKALAGFDRATLERAWEKVVARQAGWVWPNPRTIVDACRQCQPRPTPPSDQEQRQQHALDLAEAYTAQFMKTSYLARLARQEGWAGPLRDYVADAAWVQAQLLAQVKRIGWNARLADGLGPFRSSQEAFAAYRQTISAAIKDGEIHVRVPRSRICSWKEHAMPDCHITLPS
jgi:hypothetical protein